MPISSGQVAVGTAATVIDGTCTMPFALQVHNDDNSDDLFLGGPDVTITTGMRVNKLEQLRIDMNPLDKLYAVSSKAGHQVSFLVFRKSC